MIYLKIYLILECQNSRPRTFTSKCNGIEKSTLPHYLHMSMCEYVSVFVCLCLCVRVIACLLVCKMPLG